MYRVLKYVEKHVLRGKEINAFSMAFKETNGLIGYPMVILPKYSLLIIHPSAYVYVILGSEHIND